MSDSSLASIKAVCGTFIAVTTIAVALRFFARKKQQLPYLADDWCMLIAYLAFIASAACALVLGDIGWIGYGAFPYSSQDELRSRFDQAWKIIQGQDATFLVTLCFTKASALLFYRRVWDSGTGKPLFNAVIITTLVVIACWGIIFEFLAIFQCHGHDSNLWDPTTYEKWCTISLDYLYGFYVSDVILDVWVLLLPIPNILSLRMTNARKLSIIGVFLLAFLGLGASIARLVNLVRIELLGYNSFLATKPEIPESRFVFYQILEQGATILAINLPTLWGLLVKFGPETMMKAARSLRSIGSSRSRSRSSDQSSPNISSRGGGNSSAYSMHSISVPRTVSHQDIHAKSDLIQTSSVEDDVK